MFERPAAAGLDAEGYILNPTAKHLIQPEYAEVIAILPELIQQELPQIHSLYLYGSVARGKAKPGLSDLDLSVVLSQDPPENIESRFERLQAQIMHRFPLFSKVDLEAISKYELHQPGQVFEWQAWLKHFCLCLWGEDLSAAFERHKPTTRLVYHINQALPERFNTFASEMTSENVSQNSKVIAKMFIRSQYGLLASQDQSWHHEIQKCAAVLATYQPELLPLIQTALAFVERPNTDVGRALQFLKDMAYLRFKFLLLRDEFTPD